MKRLTEYEKLKMKSVMTNPSSFCISLESRCKKVQEGKFRIGKCSERTKNKDILKVGLGTKNDLGEGNNRLYR